MTASPEIVVEPSSPSAGVTRPASRVEAADGASRRQQPWSCSGCEARWTGQGRAHCGACHRTFATAGRFDRHRRGFACVDPAGIGGMREVDGIWRGPEMTDAQKARRFGGES